MAGRKSLRLGGAGANLRYGAIGRSDAIRRHGWLGISRRLNCGAISVTDTAAADLEGIGAAKNPPVAHLLGCSRRAELDTQGQTAASRMTTDSNGLACDAPPLPARARNAAC